MYATWRLFLALLLFTVIKSTVTRKERFDTSFPTFPPQPRDHLPIVAPRDTNLILYRSSSPSPQHSPTYTAYSTIETRQGGAVLHATKQRDLYTRHGATYHGQVHETILPSYHIIRVNRTTKELLHYIKTELGANWISPQVRMKRPLRNGGYENDLFLDIQNEHKKNAFKSILKKVVPRAPFDQEFEDTRKKRRMGRREMHAYDMETSEHDKNFLAFFNQQEKRFKQEQKPWEFVKDPLFRHQWHIHGNRYRRYSFESDDKWKSMPTFHLNLAPAWYSRINGREVRTLGRGVVVAVVGDGINYFHSDLRSKFVQDLSVDITTDYFTSTEEYTEGLVEQGNIRFYPYAPRTLRGMNRTDYGMSLLSQAHGTSVASLAAGSPNDGTCGTGVAPSAMVSSVRLLGSTNEVTELEEATALSYKCAVYLGNGESRGLENMIYVSSWGPSDGVSNLPVSMSEVTKDAIRGCSEIGRKGYGSVYIQAAGNGRIGGDTMDIDGYASYRYTVSVGAITYTGYPTRYSEGGESLMVVAPSSQGAMSISTASTVASFYATRVTMLRSFVAQGRPDTTIGGQRVNIHQAYSTPLVDGCTSSFGGTSASAPMIAGLVALMMEANPTLTWKDVHDILIRSAEKPHLTYSEESYHYRDHMIRSIIGAEEVDPREEKRSYLVQKVQENFFIFFAPPDRLEWLVNDETGLHHSFSMGFGLPNGAHAVNMARARRINPQTDSIIDDYSIVVSGEELIIGNRFWYTDTKAEKVEKVEKAGKAGKAGKADGQYISINRQVGHKEVGVWYVELDETNVELVQRHTHRLYDKRKNLDLVDPLEGKGDSHDNIGDMRIEQVELYINATLPASIDNIQLALCDHQKVCSLFLRGKNYDDTQLIQDHLDYTFTTVKHWGQRLGNTMQPGHGWSIMLRNNYPYYYARVVVHAMELRIYGHFTGK